VFTSIARPNKIDDLVAAAILLLGFIAGELAVVLGLHAPSLTRRPPAGVAAFVCGLSALGLLVVFVLSLVIGY
jgi:hypothetical protein